MKLADRWCSENMFNQFFSASTNFVLWGVNASEQNLVHATGVKIPIELQNKSMVVKGSIRAISCDEGSGEHPGQASVMVRAVKATVRDDVLHGRVGCFFLVGARCLSAGRT